MTTSSTPSDAEIAGISTAPRITPELVRANIAAINYLNAGKASENSRIPATAPMFLITYCILTLANGYTVTGFSVCASPENFDEQIGQRLAYKHAEDQVWGLMAYELRSKLTKLEAGELSFGDALDALQLGLRVARIGWNGKGMYLELQVPDEGSKMGRPYVYIRSVDGLLVPWVPSQTDQLARDWVIVGDVTEAAESPSLAPAPQAPAVPVPDHVTRMLEELAQLTDRLGKLRTFIDGELVKTLPLEEVVLLEQQFQGMLVYQDALTKRVERATGG